MSFDPFPERIDAHKIFTKNGSINAAVPLSSLTRFNKSLVQTDEDQGTVSVKLEFSVDESRHRKITGQLKAQVGMICQRCLVPLEVEIASDFCVLVADSEEQREKIAGRSSEEIVLSEDSELDLQALVEDELILSLPIVALHEGSDCYQNLHEQSSGEESTVNGGNEPKGVANESPFAVLAALKGKLDD